MGKTRNNAAFGNYAPNPPIGSAGESLVVNSTGDGLEYALVSGSGGGSPIITGSFSGTFASGSNYIVKSVSQASNGYSVGDWIYLSGSSTALASSNDSALSEPMIGVVTTAGDPVFSVVSEGEAVITGHGFTVGQNLYLSSSLNGEATTTVPTTGVYKQLGYVKDANTIHVRIGDTIVLGSGTDFAFVEYSFTGDGSSVNFDTPTNIGNQESVLITVGATPQSIDAYNIIGDGDGNPRRIQFTEAPANGHKIVVRYLGIPKQINTSTPVSSTDYNSGTPVPLALSTTSTTNLIQAQSNFQFSHGLGVVPKDVTALLRCIDAGGDAGYSLGDEIDIGAPFISTNWANLGTLKVNSSIIEVVFSRSAEAAFVTDPTDGTRHSLELDKWGVVVYANAEMGGTNGVIQAVNTPATEFESSEVILGTNATTLKANSNFIFPHGLSQKPKSVRPVLVCKSAELGYSVGDEVDFDNITAVGAGDIPSIKSDVTNIYFFFAQVSAGPLRLMNTDGNGTTDIDYTKWAVKVYANSELGGYKGDRGPAGTGKIAQVKKHERSDYVNLTGIIPFDDTIPQNTEGDEYFSLSFTPKNPDSVLSLEISAPVQFGPGFGVKAIFVDNNVDAIYAQYKSSYSDGERVLIPANGTNTRTYKVRMGQTSAGSGVFLNGSGGFGHILGSAIKSTFSITEILP